MCEKKKILGIVREKETKVGKQNYKKGPLGFFFTINLILSVFCFTRILALYWSLVAHIRSQESMTDSSMLGTRKEEED